MWGGPPKDVPGKCNARLYIGDDFGDNHATMRCGLPPGHRGFHREEYSAYGGRVRVSWEKDEREPVAILVANGEERILYDEDVVESDD